MAKSSWMQTAVGLLTAALVTSCMSLEQAAPPVMSVTGGDSPSRRTVLESGRAIYITKCAKCHAVEPVLKYSSQRWAELIPEMAEESKLDARETEAVRAYIYAVLGRSRGSNY